MKNQLYSIGELSKLKGISVKTLRFYDEIGVLKPNYVDPFTKYRYYNKVQFVYVDILKALKALRTGTKEIFQKEDDLFYPKEYFIEVHSQNSSKLKMIPAGMYACISYSRDNADEQIKKMNDYLGGSNVNVAQVVQIELLEDIFKETSYFELQILLGE